MASLCVFCAPHGGPFCFPLKDVRGQKAPKDKTSNSLFVLLIFGGFSNGTATAMQVRKAPAEGRRFGTLVSRLLYQQVHGDD